MKKGTRYLLAVVACFAIFVLYVICQMVIAKGMLVTVLFMGAMAAAWKAIVGNKKGEGSDEKGDKPKSEGNDCAAV